MTFDPGAADPPPDHGPYLFVDGKDGSDGDQTVDVGRAIQRIETYDVFALKGNRNDLWPLCGVDCGVTQSRVCVDFPSVFAQ